MTIPHKEAAAGLAAECGRAERPRAGAANTLVRAAPAYFAANTDYHGRLERFRRTCRPRDDGTPRPLHQCGVLVLGAGGVARAVAHALHKAGARR